MNQQATRVRYVVLAFVCALSMITYLDRACFGQVLSILGKELALDAESLKGAITAFYIAYGIFEIPTGWLGDVWGPRRTLLRIVLWWSVFTALTAIVGLKFGGYMFGGLGLLITLRFLFGVGEAGAYPNITRALHNWIPRNQTATAQGWVWFTGRLVGGLTPLVWTFLVLGTSKTNPLLGWRAAFVLFGLIGVAWAIAFAIFFRDHPHEHRLVNEAERNLIEAGRETSEAPDTKLPVRAFVRSRNLWLLCIMYFCMVYAWTFNITYLPTYLTKRFDMSSQPVLSAIYQGGPLWAGAICSLIGGIFVDWLIRRTGDRRRTRQYVGMIADTLSALGMIAAIFAPNVHLFFIAISLSAMSNDMTLASAWAACQDIGQQFTAVTAACMNTVGTLGAALAGWLTGTIVQGTLASHAAALALPIKQLSQNDAHNAQMAGYNYSFITFAAAYFISAICWRFIDSTKPIVPAAPLEAST